jgi:hypothetical protein
MTVANEWWILSTAIGHGKDNEDEDMDGDR